MFALPLSLTAPTNAPPLDSEPRPRRFNFLSMVCSNCGGSGHNRTTCPSLGGGGGKGKPKKKAQRKYVYCLPGCRPVQLPNGSIAMEPEPQKVRCQCPPIPRRVHRQGPQGASAFFLTVLISQGCHPSKLAATLSPML